MRNAIIVLIGLGCLQSPCMADEQFRCGQWVVSQQVSVVELLKKCGEPTSKSSSSQIVRARNAVGYWPLANLSTTEVWTYDRGSRSFAMVVTIVDGKIKSMSRSQ